MRLSKRERFLLAVLTLLLLWTGFYKFWIEPETDLLFANLQEINRLEEQIKRGGPQGKQNLEQMAEKLEQAGNGQIYFADMSPEKWTESFCSLQEKLGYNFPEWKQGKQKRWIQQVMCIHLLHWNLCVQTGNRQPDLWKRSTRKAPVCG